MLYMPNFRLSKMNRFILFLAVLLLGAFLTINAQPQPQEMKPPEPFTPAEWKDKRAEFLKLYQDKLPEKRKEAIELIDKTLGPKLVASPYDYAVETMEFLFRVLAVEPDEAVLSATNVALVKFISSKKTGMWITRNQAKLVTPQRTKLRFIDTLRQAAKVFQHEPVNMLFDLAEDKDKKVSLAALKAMSEIKDFVRIDELIRLLGTEKRAEIKPAIGQALETITGQKYTTDFAAWQKWLAELPVDQTQVDAAIQRGTDYLKQVMHGTAEWEGKPESELVLYALLRSGVEMPDVFLNSVFNRFKLDLLGTYNVALMAMALTELDPVKHRQRIAQCASFLVANQSPNGNWRYSHGNPLDKYIDPIVITPSSKPVTPTEGTSTRAVETIKIRIPPRRRDTDYDNSCTQYAILGLRACVEANIEIPPKVWADAEKHLLDNQLSDGGWNYTNESKYSYGSMAAGGLGSLAICKYYQSKKINGDKNIKRGLDWLIKNFTVLRNPKSGGMFHFYYLYALERVGALLGTEYFGPHHWYPIGARYLLGQQKPDGSWTLTMGPWCGNNVSFSGGNRIDGSNEIADTCFALLFLRRATKPLVVITSSSKKKVVITPGGEADRAPPANENAPKTNEPFPVKLENPASEYYLYVPDGYAHNKSWPLLVVLHGASGSAKNFIGAWTNNASKYGYIVLAVKSIKDQWSKNDGTLILSAIDDVKKQYLINSDLVFMAGFSSGAFMASEFGMENYKLFRIIGAFGGATFTSPPKAAKDKISIFIICGALDRNLASAKQSLVVLKSGGLDVELKEVPGLDHALRSEDIGWLCEKIEKKTQSLSDLIRRVKSAQDNKRYLDAISACNAIVAKESDADAKALEQAQADARKSLADIEKLGQDSMKKAKDFIKNNQAQDAKRLLQQILKDFAGLPIALEAAQELKNLPKVE